MTAENQEDNSGFKVGSILRSKTATDTIAEFVDSMPAFQAFRNQLQIAGAPVAQQHLPIVDAAKRKGPLPSLMTEVGEVRRGLVNLQELGAPKDMLSGPLRGLYRLADVADTVTLNVSGGKMKDVFKKGLQPRIDRQLVNSLRSVTPALTAITDPQWLPYDPKGSRGLKDLDKVRVRDIIPSPHRGLGRLTDLIRTVLAADMMRSHDIDRHYDKPRGRGNFHKQSAKDQGLRAAMDLESGSPHQTKAGVTALDEAWGGSSRIPKNPVVDIVPTDDFRPGSTYTAPDSKLAVDTPKKQLLRGVGNLGKALPFAGDALAFKDMRDSARRSRETDERSGSQSDAAFEARMDAIEKKVDFVGGLASYLTGPVGIVSDLVSLSDFAPGKQDIAGVGGDDYLNLFGEVIQATVTDPARERRKEEQDAFALETYGLTREQMSELSDEELIAHMRDRR